jgi:hypothetical protein
VVEEGYGEEGEVIEELPKAIFVLKSNNSFRFVE